MKKIIYILAIISIPFLNSCEVENSENPNPRTLQAKVAYDYVDKSMLQYIDLLDLMTKVDHYAEASADKQDGIKSFFLPDYSLIKTNDTWILKNANEKITFHHNNKSINENGAIWTADVNLSFWDGDSTIIAKDRNFVVECLGAKDWKITTSDIYLNYTYYYGDKPKSSSVLYVKGFDAYANSKNVYNFKIEAGSGGLDIDKSKINYNILQTIIYSDSNNNFNLFIQSGELDVLLDSEKINVVITPSSYYPNIKITYKGITETY